MTGLGGGLAHALQHVRPDDVDERARGRVGHLGGPFGIGEGGKLDQLGLAF